MTTLARHISIRVLKCVKSQASNSISGIVNPAVNCAALSSGEVVEYPGIECAMAQGWRLEQCLERRCCSFDIAASCNRKRKHCSTTVKQNAISRATRTSICVDSAGCVVRRAAQHCLVNQTRVFHTSLLLDLQKCSIP
jgi:hypothetical protein